MSLRRNFYLNDNSSDQPEPCLGPLRCDIQLPEDCLLWNRDQWSHCVSWEVMSHILQLITEPHPPANYWATSSSLLLSHILQLITEPHPPAYHWATSSSLLLSHILFWYKIAFSIFREIWLSLLVGCDYRDYRNFFCLSDNRYFAIIANYFAWVIIMIIAIIAIITYTK
jgi:hypothetical protein